MNVTSDDLQPLDPSNGGCLGRGTGGARSDAGIRSAATGG